MYIVAEIRAYHKEYVWTMNASSGKLDEKTPHPVFL